MDGLTLVIGNKNYSSWSMRPWVLLTATGVPFEEVKLRFHSPEWEARIASLSPSGRVPVLRRGETAVWDSLAIVETVNDWFPGRGVWPDDPLARAFARSACAEMHAGFGDLRTHMPMNIRSRHPGKGMTPGVAANIRRIEQLWEEARERFGGGGDFLFGPFGAADAMYAPVVMRFETYGVAMGPVAGRYREAVRTTPAVAAWVAGALEEPEFVAEDEPYASPPG